MNKISIIFLFFLLFFVNKNSMAESFTDSTKEINLANQQHILNQYEESKRSLVNDLFKNNKSLFINSPYYGNKNGRKVIYELFDYHCIYCKSIHASLHDMVKKDNNLKVILLDYPILQKTSLVAAMYAYAVFHNYSHEQYMAYHDALFSAPKPLTLEKILELAQLAGFDAKKLDQMVDNPQTMDYMKSVYDMARALELSGTPVVIYNGIIIIGAVPEQKIQTIVNES